MDDEIIIVCLTDLTGSVRSTGELGHETFLPHVDHVRNTTDALVELTHGKTIKGKGDGDIIVFRSPTQAVRFAALLQSHFQQNTALQTISNKVRVSIFSGEARVGEGDIDGSAINLASRIENIAEPGQVVINDTLVKSLRAPWGRDKHARLVSSIGERQIKGGDPPEQELFQIDWLALCMNNPDESLAGLIYNHLKNANVDISNLSVVDLLRPGVIVWPAVPRDVVTAIHRGQTEIIRLLALLGWQVHLLIEDCAGSGELPRSSSDAFQKRLEDYVARRNLTLANVSRLSDYYNIDDENHHGVQKLFKEVTAKLTLQQMESINRKEYDDARAAQIVTAPTLKFLTPALSIAVVIHLARAIEQKVIIVSGADERKQWEGSYNISNARQKIGAIMHPVLTQDPVSQAFQSSNWPIWDSEGALIHDMTSDKPTNLAWWVVDLHAFVPAFPRTSVEIGDGTFPADWPNRDEIPNNIQAADIARRVWPLLGPPA